MIGLRNDDPFSFFFFPSSTRTSGRVIGKRYILPLDENGCLVEWCRPAVKVIEYDEYDEYDRFRMKGGKVRASLHRSCDSADFPKESSRKSSSPSKKPKYARDTREARCSMIHSIRLRSRTRRSGKLPARDRREISVKRCKITGFVRAVITERRAIDDICSLRGGSFGRDSHEFDKGSGIPPARKGRDPPVALPFRNPLVTMPQREGVRARDTCYGSARTGPRGSDGKRGLKRAEAPRCGTVTLSPLCPVPACGFHRSRNGRRYNVHTVPPCA